VVAGRRGVRRKSEEGGLSMIEEEDKEEDADDEMNIPVL
jgi:hypothetical protein